MRTRHRRERRAGELLRRRRPALRLSVIASAIIVIAYLAFSNSTLLRVIEGYALDLRFRLRGVEHPGQSVVLVLVDERSIGEIGRWTWDRGVFSRAVDELTSAGAEVIAFDLLFTEPHSAVSIAPIEELREAILRMMAAPVPARERHFDDIRVELTELEDELTTDQDFASSIAAAGNVLIPFSFIQRAASEFVAPPTPPSKAIMDSAYRSFRYPDGYKSDLPFIADDVLPPVPSIAGAAASLAHVNFALDADGTARYEYPVIEYQRKHYPSLAIQAARLFRGLAIEETRVEFTDGMSMGGTWIPTDESMRMVVNFYGPNGTFPSYSFADVLHGRIADSVFDGKIVLIGASAIGIADRFVSPFSAVLGGTERIATIINNILESDFVVRRNSYLLVDAAAAFAGGVLLGLLSSWLSAYTFSLVAFALGIAFALGNHAVFLATSRWFNLTLPIFTLVLVYTILSVHRYIYRERQEKWIRRAFGRFLHPDLVERMVSDGFELEARSRFATIVFTDIRRFTTIAERMSPQRLVDLLNEYFDAISKPIEGHGGMITQYQGDALLAIFNVHVNLPDHASRAVASALEILEISRTRKFSDSVVLETNVGINSGDVVAGSVGSRDHVTYTVHGDAVNLAARLEALNKEHGTRILISQDTFELLDGRYPCKRIGELAIRGKRHSTTVYEVIADSEGAET